MAAFVLQMQKDFIIRVHTEAGICPEVNREWCVVHKIKYVSLSYSSYNIINYIFIFNSPHFF